VLAPGTIFQVVSVNSNLSLSRGQQQLEWFEDTTKRILRGSGVVRFDEIGIRLKKPLSWAIRRRDIDYIAIKIYLDDLRSTPEGWIRVYWPDEAIELLKMGNVDISVWITILEMMNVAQVTT